MALLPRRRYRGYPIEQLAERSDFLDCAFLLLHGALPDATERAQFRGLLRSHRLCHEHLIRFYRGFKTDAPPMAMLVAVVGALSSFYPDSTDVTDPARRELACVRVIAKLPVLSALAFKCVVLSCVSRPAHADLRALSIRRTSIGQPPVYPRDDLGYAENLLYMMFAVPTRPWVVDPVAAETLETILVLHLDHEQNASTSTVRIAGSSQANPFACVASGIASLWGPAHGGANEAVIKMLEEIGTEANIPAFLARAKDKGDTFRLMGFGHRVYKTKDPRAALMARLAHRLLEHLARNDDPLLQLALALEKAASADPYFVSRKLYANVDFFSGICLRALGVPTCMFTPLFAVARATGWVSQWREMASEGGIRISRPRQMYAGHMRRDVPPVDERPPSGAGCAASAVPLDPADILARMPPRRDADAHALGRAFSVHVPNPIHTD